jgi:hypothetical protein
MFAKRGEDAESQGTRGYYDYHEEILENKLQQILNKYQKIEGEWTKNDIENFVSELSGHQSLDDIAFSERINY